MFDTNTTRVVEVHEHCDDTDEETTEPTTPDPKPGECCGKVYNIVLNFN